jgi:hypothetical protein
MIISFKCYGNNKLYKQITLKTTNDSFASIQENNKTSSSFTT